MFYILILIAILSGVILGNSLPVLPYEYSVYLSLGILVALNSVFEAISDIIREKFDFKIFLAGLLGSVTLTIAITYLGLKLNLDIYMAIIVVFVLKMYENMSTIQRYYINRGNEKYEKIKKNFIHLQTDLEYLNSNEDDKIPNKKNKNKTIEK